MKIFFFLALALCVYGADLEEKTKVADSTKDKRQTQDELVHTHVGYRIARKQELVAPVQEPQEDDKPLSRSDAEEYRPGQVFSLNAQELLELQPERKAPLGSNIQLQQLYSNPQPEHKQNLQQLYYLEPQTARQVAYQPSHAVIARPDFSSNGGEASVGAALSVSDGGSSSGATYNQDLFSLLGQSPVRSETQQIYAQPPQHQSQQSSTVQSVAPQYQQVDRYVSKPSKKSKLRNKVQITPPQPSPSAPQQYLIETTNVQQQQQQPQQPLYRQAPQPQRAPQSLRFVAFPQTPQVSQQILYDRPETGLKIVPAPKLQQQQPRGQLNYRILPQYSQPEASPKQYRVLDAPRQVIRPQEQRLSSVERPVAYLKRFPEQEKMRSVRVYDPIHAEGLPPQPAQIIGDQYYLRPYFRGTEQRLRYDPPTQIKPEQSRVSEVAKQPQSSIFVSKNLPRNLVRPQQGIQPNQQNYEPINLEQHGHSLEEQRAHLPPPKNNKAYTPEEFESLLAAGYSVTPIPVSAANLQEAQSRSSVEYPKRRPIYASRRHHYLPLRGDEAP